MWIPVSFICHFYSSFLPLGWHYNNIHTWCRYIYFLCLMWWGSVRIDLSKIFPPYLYYGPQLYKSLHYFCSFLPGLYLEVSLWLILVLVLLCAAVPLLCSLIFQDVSWWVFMWGLTKYSVNLVWLTWGGFLLLSWNFLHEVTVLVLVKLSVIE